MAKTLDVLVQECIGAQVMQILRMQMENEAQREEIEALKAAQAKKAE